MNTWKMDLDVLQYPQELAETLDRLKEAAHFLSQMIEHYHLSSDFRYTFNAFLRALDEIPEILCKEAERKFRKIDRFSIWKEMNDLRMKDYIDSEPISSFGKIRDKLVHQKIIFPNSTASIGVLKNGNWLRDLNLNVDPFADSHLVIFDYVLSKPNDPLGLLQLGQDEKPCLRRQWILDQFSDEDVVQVAVRGYNAACDYVSHTNRWLGKRPIEHYDLPADQKYQLYIYEADIAKNVSFLLQHNKVLTKSTERKHQIIISEIPKEES